MQAEETCSVVEKCKAEQVVEVVQVETEKKHTATSEGMSGVNPGRASSEHWGIPWALYTLHQEQEASTRKSRVCMLCQHACKRYSWMMRDSAEVLLEGGVREQTSHWRLWVEVVSPKGASACKKAQRWVDSEEEEDKEEEVKELVPHPLEEVAALHVDALGMLMEMLNVLLMKVTEVDTWRDWVETQ